MAEQDFEFYKQQMRDYWSYQTSNSPAPNLELSQIINGLRSTFPKKPQQSDRLALCYAYYFRSQLPMEPDYEKDWRKHIKSYINATTGKNKNDDTRLYFMLVSLKRTADISSAKESFDYADKAVKKMTITMQNHPNTKEIIGQLAYPYYDELFDRAKRLSLDDEKYNECLKTFDKATYVLLKIPHAVRYQKSQELKNAMRVVYNQTEHGREEFPRKCCSISRRVYRSMPPEVRSAMHSSASHRDYNSR